jgi:hypothetical protein
MSPVPNLNGTYSKQALERMVGSGDVAQLAREAIVHINEAWTITGLEYAARIRDGRFAGLAVLEG